MRKPKSIYADYWDVPVDVTTHTDDDGVTTSIMVTRHTLPLAGNTLVVCLVLVPVGHVLEVVPFDGWVLESAKVNDYALAQIHYCPNCHPQTNYRWTMKSVLGVVPTAYAKMIECQGVWTPDEREKAQ